MNGINGKRIDPVFVTCKGALLFSAKIIFAYQLVRAARKDMFPFSNELENLSIRAADFIGFLSFFDLPDVQLLVASCATNKLAVGTKNDGLHRPLMPCVRGFQFASFGVKNSSA